MALLLLLALMLVASLVVLLAPVLRLRESGSLASGALIQSLPSFFALAYLVLFRSEPVAQVPAQVRPELEEALLLALAFQLVATPLALRGSLVAPAARVGYTVLSAGGAVGVVLLVGWFTR